MSIGTVSIKYGRVSGTEHGGRYLGITGFKGIPYARPPIGALRWRPPQDPEPWAGVRACTRSGPIPMQFPSSAERYQKEFCFNGMPSMSEDCLYLDIYTQAENGKEKLPVYIWFHGGGLTRGFAYEAVLDPREFARRGIVVVIVEQRLNIFGYLSLPQLSAEQGGASGNYGFMDQIKALDWVCENIEAFGGNPENITVGGHSGGALKAGSMAASPAAKGRIKRVINESGLKWMKKFNSLEKAEQAGRTYLQNAGYDPDTSANRLRELSGSEILKNVPGCGGSGHVCDGHWIPCLDLREAFGKYLNGVDMLNGSNLGEADIFSKSMAFQTAASPDGTTARSKITCAGDFYSHFKDILGPLYSGYDFEGLVRVTDDSAASTAAMLASLGLAGGVGTNYSRNLMLNRMFGKYMSRRYPGSKIFTYYFTHMMPVRGQNLGSVFDPAYVYAWHSSELWYSFNSLREGVPPHRPWRESDRRVGGLMNAYFANFITTGDPNGGELPFWPETKDRYGYLEISAEPTCSEGIASKLEELIREFNIAEYMLDPEMV